jgi:hypothetical protein
MRYGDNSLLRMIRMRVGGGPRGSPRGVLEGVHVGLIGTPGGLVVTGDIGDGTGAPNKLSDDLKLFVRHQSVATKTRQSSVG